MPMPAKGMELPPHVDQRLREEFRCHMVPVRNEDGSSIDALYVTPEEPHQQSLFSGAEIESDLRRDLGMVSKKVDALYVTRFQKERWTDKDQDYPRIDRNFLNEPQYSDASVMHPLPRVGELDVAFDSDKRAVYFEQAAYGVPIRMALIALLLGLNGETLQSFEGGFEHERYEVYEQPRGLGLHCANSNCIVHDPMEAQYVRNKFYVVPSNGAQRLRCVYCEREIEHVIVGNKKNKWYSAGPVVLAPDHSLKDNVLFADEAEAQAAGFHPRRTTTEHRPESGAGPRLKT
jgi:hypothetical protein